MKHVDTVRRSKPIEYAKLRNEVFGAVRRTYHDNFSIGMFRVVLTKPHTSGAIGDMTNEGQKMWHAVEEYIDTAMMATHPLVNTESALKLSEQKLAAALAVVAPTLINPTHDAVAFGKEMAEEIAKVTKKKLTELGVPIIDRSRGAGK